MEQGQAEVLLRGKRDKMLIEKLRLVMSETKFKTGISKMYYYGTKKEASAFWRKLEKCCEGKRGKR